jgi:hydrogenase nickel incorporation protein HypB
MCEACGCGERYSNEKTSSGQEHSHGHHHHSHEARTIDINLPALQKNDNFASANRTFFNGKGVLSINLISSPGSGKTTLLEQLAKRLGRKMAVVVGDIQTRRDADRIIGSGSSAYQIETHGACHLDAHGVGHALEHLDFKGVEFCVIENVGNLVCPAAYDLGEAMKITILSTPEGDDKVLKYPEIFSRTSAVLINKIDLASHLDFDVDKVIRECKSLNARCDIFKIAAKTGTGIDLFCEYLKNIRNGLLLHSK